MRFVQDSEPPTGFDAEWRISNRDFPIKAEHELKPAVARCTKYFETPHMLVDFAAKARSTLVSRQGAYNVKSYLMRESGDMKGGARMGCAPWQVGELATALLCYAIFYGRYEDSDAYNSTKLDVTKEHVDRAAICLRLINELKDTVITWGDKHHS